MERIELNFNGLTRYVRIDKGFNTYYLPVIESINVLMSEGTLPSDTAKLNQIVFEFKGEYNTCNFEQPVRVFKIKQ
jgi:hypothetical protein